MAVGASGRTGPAPGARTGSMRLIALRALACALVAIWIGAGGGPAWEAWVAAVNFAEPLAKDGRSPAGGHPLEIVTVLAGTARTACPGDGPVLVISDDPFAWLRGNYLLYPRRLDVVQSVDGFTAVDLDAHRGGCLFTYGPQRARIEPFRPRLTAAGCAGDDCVYRITEATSR